MEISCVKCKIVDKICRKPEGCGPKFCPTLTKKDIIEKALKEYVLGQLMNYTVI